MQAVEEIPFERVRQIKATSQEKKATDVLQVLASADKAVISGRCAALDPQACEGGLVPLCGWR